MDVTSLVTLGLYLGCHIPPAFFVLKKIGVTSQLLSRSCIFGITLGLLQFVLPIAFVFVSFKYGYLAGGLLGVVLSYFYVKYVVNLKWYQNIGVVVLFPIAAAICAAPLMYLLYLVNA
jgi:hypothetical protein